MMKKEQILKEIQRTAAANGGKPLGWRRFVTETGIRESDWFGVHWPRWSDALIEAGFDKNELTIAYKPEELLKKLADLALELGKLPSNADYRFCAKRNAGFPSDKTFSRLGSRDQIIKKLAEFCQLRPEYAKVRELCEVYKPRASKDTDTEIVSHEGDFGYVYLFKFKSFFKVGMSNSVGRREYELAIQLPEKLTLVHKIKTDDPPGIEHYWHSRFASKRKNGEWFDLTAEDVAAFKRRKFFM